jgi:GTPase SAR1 family protein
MIGWMHDEEAYYPLLNVSRIVTVAKSKDAKWRVQMAAKRDWTLFGSNFGKEIVGPAAGTSAAGITVATAAQIFAVTGLYAATAPVALGVTVAGGLLGLGGIAAVLYRSIPRKKVSASDYSNKTITIDQLIDLHPPILKIGIIGDTQAGKTTLIKRILQKIPQKGTTIGVSAYIAALQTNPINYIALMDGQGQEFSDQFKVASPADLLIVVMDHNISHTEISTDPERTRDTLKFQKQLIGHMRSEKRKANKPRLYILANKRDLWQKQAPNDLASFRAFIREIVIEWEKSNLIEGGVIDIEHSNLSPDDIARLLEMIVSHIPVV